MEFGRDLFGLIAYLIPIGEHQNFVRVNKMFLGLYNKAFPNLVKTNTLNRLYDKCGDGVALDLLKELKGRRSFEVLCFLLLYKNVNVSEYYDLEPLETLITKWTGYEYYPSRRCNFSLALTEIIMIRDDIFRLISDCINFDILLKNKELFLTFGISLTTRENFINYIKSFDCIQMATLFLNMRCYAVGRILNKSIDYSKYPKIIFEI